MTRLDPATRRAPATKPIVDAPTSTASTPAPPLAQDVPATAKPIVDARVAQKLLGVETVATPAPRGVPSKSPLSTLLAHRMGKPQQTPTIAEAAPASTTKGTAAPTTTQSISAALDEVLADRKLTPVEWAMVKTIGATLPFGAFEGARRLIEVFTAGHEVDAGTHWEAAKFLREHGYPVPRGVSPRTPLVDVDAVLAGNVTEKDRGFEALCKALAVPDVPVIVGVLDGGFDVEHPALKKRGDAFKEGERSHWDFAQNVASAKGYEDTHGTHVAAVATRGSDRLVPLCLAVLAKNEVNALDLRGFDAAVAHAVAHGAKVINFSVATTNVEEAEAVRTTVAKHPDVLFVLGAGNSGLPLGAGKYAPEKHVAAQDLPNVCVVTSAVDGQLAGGSAFGGTTQIAALGEDVLSARARGDFVSYSGTSMASPQVAAAAAKCVTLDPTLTAVQLRAVLDVTADKSPALDGVVRAGGEVNSLRACRLVAVARCVRDGEPLLEAAARLDVPRGEVERLTADLAAIAA